jgi:cytochrome oxidase Cu insertion factor (SCO1/SenC/PrrC family)
MVTMKTLALAALAGLLAQAQGKGRPDQGAGPDVGKPAPDWTLKSQDGKQEVELSKLKGKPVLLIFGSWT